VSPGVLPVERQENTAGREKERICLT